MYCGCKMNWSTAPQVALCLKLFGVIYIDIVYYTLIYLREITHGYKVDKYPWDVLSDHLQCTSYVSLIVISCYA